MKTKIFKDFSDFWNREDKALNGVSEEFADENPDYENKNETNDGCWNCSDCSDCSRCSDCSGCSDCSRCSDCSGCSDCSRCSDCSDCSDCSRCSDCSDCSDCSRCSRCSRCSGCSGCSDLENASPVSVGTKYEYPKIQNPHSAVLEAVTKKGELKMNDWHHGDKPNGDGEYCGTTHCWAGWIVTLAGKAGRDLEERTSTSHAAMMIANASSDIKIAPVRFFESNEIAMANIVKYAELENLQNKANENNHNS